MMLFNMLVSTFITGLTYYTKPLLADNTDVRWEMSPWSECQINKTCEQLGLKIRTVACVQNDKHVSQAICEKTLHHTPLSIETCVPQKCAIERKSQIRIVRTNWSQCQIGKTNELLSYRKLFYNNNNNNNINNKSCRNKNEILISYIRIRASTCHFEYNDKTLHIVDALICAKIFNMSSTIEKKLCYQKCINPCALTTWSKWKHCKHCRKQQIKYKSREYASLPGNGEYARGLCPRQIRTKLKRTRTRTEFQYKVAEWKHVSILYQQKKTRSKFSIYKRNVTCIDRQGNVCDQKNEKIVKIQIQVGDIDCRHGLWSPWAKCVPKSKGSRKYKQYRYRDILLYPSGDGKTCGDVRQERKCNVNALQNEDDAFKWDNGNWSPCFLDLNYKIPVKNNCSVYVSRRDIFCLKKSTNQPFDDIYCRRKSGKPTNKRLCKVLCHHDCLYSDWSEWSQCANNIKERHRENLNKSPLTLCRSITQRKACSLASQKNEDSSVVINNAINGNFFWHQTSWSECEIPIKSKNNTSHDCLIGTQMRKNICVKDDILDVVNDSFCADYLPDAPQVRKCFICPKKCSLTKWSQWYPQCSATCNPFDNNQRAFTQRMRYILSHGNKYGEECPDVKLLHETKECPKCLGYNWVTERWDVCTHSGLQSVYQPMIKGLQNGYQIRNVYCTDGSHVVADSLCNELKPIDFRECHINWLVTCNIKPWSDWFECSEVCGGGQQKRIRSFTSEDCKNEENLKLNETRVCNTQACGYYRTEKSPWGPCHPIGELSHCSNRFTGLRVNLGVKYRNITCYDEEDKVVPNKYCEEYDEEVLPSKRRCILPCINDCRMSKWSDFTPCSATCGEGVSYRTRKIYIHASKENKRQCPPNDGRFVKQSVSCKVNDCFDFKWQKEKWDECKIDEPSKCGQGKQERNVTCIQQSTGKPSSKCDLQEKPRTGRKCNVPCNGSTNRTRRLEKGGLKCSKSSRKKNCRKQINASWKPSDWSSCFVEGNNEDGIRTRLVECVSVDTEKPVHPKHCKTSPSQLTHEMCKLHSQNNCELTQWTTWSSCEKQCGVTTHKSRTRKCNGHCGNEKALKETLVCPMLPCFKLTLGEWSKCKPLYENSCGEGTRERDARCTRDDGNIVDLHHCRNRLTGKSLVKESCHIPCWNDCVLTEWSQWSACYGGCEQKEYERKSGYQVRSRFTLQEPTDGGKSCSKKLEEKRPCYNPQCFTFKWVTKNGQYKCQRSDGITVSTGCKLLPFMYECDCTLSHATCIQKQYCMCEQGYVSETDRRGNLVNCAYSNSVHSSKTAKQNIENKSVSVFGIVCISVAACVGYCLLFAVVMFLYKRRNKKQLLRSISSKSAVLGGTLKCNNQHRSGHSDRTRNLIRLSNRHSNSCSSGISSTGMTEQTPLSSLQTGVDTIAMDSDHYDDDTEGILTML